MESWAKELYRSAKKNAKKRKIEFLLTAAEFEQILSSSKMRCAVSGIPFEFEKANGKKRPFAPSLDRIDSSKGYMAQNVRIVCVATNVALNEWGLGTLERLAQGILGLNSDVDAAWRARGRKKYLPGVKMRVGKNGSVRYVSRIIKNGKRRHLGSFISEIEAHLAYKAAKSPNIAPK